MLPSLSCRVQADAQELAYTASFGEYNPGGGKDAVKKYMDQSLEKCELGVLDLEGVLASLEQ